MPSFPTSSPRILKKEMVATLKLQRPRGTGKSAREVPDFGKNLASHEMDFFQEKAVQHLIHFKLNGRPLKDLERARWFVDRLIEVESQIEEILGSGSNEKATGNHKS